MEENRNAYSEVIAILKLLDDEKKLAALPIEMLEVLKSKANPEYKPLISKKIPLDEQNLQPETLSILSWIAMKYWNEEVLAEVGDDLEAEQEIEKKAEHEHIQEIREEAEQKRLQESEQGQEPTQEEVQKAQEETKEQAVENASSAERAELPALYKDLKWYQKIKIKIIEFFNRIFRRHHVKEKTNEMEGNIL